MEVLLHMVVVGMLMVIILEIRHIMDVLLLQPLHIMVRQHIKLKL